MCWGKVGRECSLNPWTFFHVEGALTFRWVEEQSEKPWDGRRIEKATLATVWAKKSPSPEMREVQEAWEAQALRQEMTLAVGHKDLLELCRIQSLGHSMSAVTIVVNNYMTTKTGCLHDRQPITYATSGGLCSTTEGAPRSWRIQLIFWPCLWYGKSKVGVIDALTEHTTRESVPNTWNVGTYLGLVEIKCSGLSDHSETPPSSSKS